MTDPLLNRYWLNQLVSYDKLLVGFSGGLDSTVLLHILSLQPELHCKISAVHIHHGLSTNASVWQSHCQQFCAEHEIPIIVRQVEFARGANIEENARMARYQEFAALLADHDCLLLAHHRDDQAETLLLQLFRGAGLNGLSAMLPSKPFARGNVVRPLLDYSRKMLEDYAKLHKLAWIEDESNQDCTFSRNYLRHEIVPLLQEKWPGVVNSLVRSASHCQQALRNLEALALIDCAELAERNDTLSLLPLQTLTRDRLSNVLRLWLKNNQVRLPSTTIFNCLIDEVMAATMDAQPCVQWGTVRVTRYQQKLYLLKNEICLPVTVEWSNFPERIFIEGLGFLQATAVDKGLRVPAGIDVQVRFREGGELFNWHGQTKQLKKLLQQWQVPPWQRDSIPLIYIDNCLAAIVGFAISDDYYSNEPAQVYSIVHSTDER